MQFFIRATDYTDPEAIDRRMAVREDHLKKAREMEANGSMLWGGAILDADGKMIGSAAITEFPNREAVDEWLNSDPYVTGKVWEKIEVEPFRTAIPYQN